MAPRTCLKNVLNDTLEGKIKPTYSLKGQNYKFVSHSSPEEYSGNQLHVPPDFTLNNKAQCCDTKEIYRQTPENCSDEPQHVVLCSMA
jgi:hypothetical protein